MWTCDKLQRADLEYCIAKGIREAINTKYEIDSLIRIFELSIQVLGHCQTVRTTYLRQVVKYLRCYQNLQ